MNVAACSAKFALERTVELPAVRDAGQRVDGDQTLQALIGSFECQSQLTERMISCFQRLHSFAKLLLEHRVCLFEIDLERPLRLLCRFDLADPTTELSMLAQQQSERCHGHKRKQSQHKRK